MYFAQRPIFKHSVSGIGNLIYMNFEVYRLQMQNRVRKSKEMHSLQWLITLCHFQWSVSYIFLSFLANKQAHTWPKTSCNPK